MLLIRVYKISFGIINIPYFKWNCKYLQIKSRTNCYRNGKHAKKRRRCYVSDWKIPISKCHIFTSKKTTVRNVCACLDTRKILLRCLKINRKYSKNECMSRFCSYTCFLF